MAPLNPKIVLELRQLHAHSVEVEKRVHLFSGRQARRERREARQAENDLLRGLGFESYDAFAATIAEKADTLPEVRPNDAHETEAELLRLLESRSGDHLLAPEVAPHAAPAALPSVDVEQLVARVGAVEEELAEARFEVSKLREDIAALRAGPESALNVFQRTLQEAAQEVVRFGEVLHAGQERILAEAAHDAERLREEATAEARQVVDRAQAEAVALTRDALVTIDGLHRLAEVEAIAILPPVEPERN